MYLDRIWNSTVVHKHPDLSGGILEIPKSSYWVHLEVTRLDAPGVDVNRVDGLHWLYRLHHAWVCSCSGEDGVGVWIDHSRVHGIHWNTRVHRVDWKIWVDWGRDGCGCDSVLRIDGIIWVVIRKPVAVNVRRIAIVIQGVRWEAWSVGVNGGKALGGCLRWLIRRSDGRLRYCGGYWLSYRSWVDCNRRIDRCCGESHCG